MTVSQLKRMDDQYDPVFGDIASDESGPLDKDAIRTIALDTEWPITISGDVGCGKTTYAMLMHYLLGGAFDRFICCWGSELSPNLHETMLFGHRKGSFTGATENRTGVVPSAEDGTLFLDDLRYASIEAQCTLLNFCQDKTFRRVGEETISKSNARLIYGCHLDMGKLVEKGLFKKDLLDRLLYRSHIVYIRPLREVKHLLPGITQYFLDLMGNKINFTGGAYKFICEYDWPGQMRQLEGTIAKLSRKCSGSVSREVLEKFVLTIANTTSCSNTTASSDQMLAYFQSWGGKFNDFGKEASRIVFQDSYERHNHVGKEVARELGISPQKVVNCKEKYKMPIRHSRKLF